MPVIEHLNKAKNRIEVTCSSDPDHLDYRPLGYVDNDGDYHLPDGSILPAEGGVIDPYGELRGRMKWIMRPDGVYTMPGPGDAADPEGTYRSRIHAVDARQQAEYDAQTPTK